MAVIYEEREKVNNETGEVVRETTTITRTKSDEPPFAKFYIDGWLAFRQISSVNHKFLFELMPFTSYADAGQVLSLTSYQKRLIGKKLNWKEESVLNRFNHELRKLTQAGVLKKIERSTYIVNPDLIGKGDWKDIRRLRVTFNLDTGEIYHNYAPEWEKEAPIDEEGEKEDQSK